MVRNDNLHQSALLIRFAADMKVETSKLLDAKALLEKAWDSKSRPSLRWLREQQRNRTIPYIRVGRSIFFILEDVLSALSKLTVRPRIQ